MKIALVSLLALSSAMAFSANIFRIKIDSYGGATAQQREAIDKVVSDIEKSVRDELPDGEVSNFLNSSSNAQVMAGKNVGTDYVNDMKLFMIGAGAGVGVDVGGNSLSDVLGGDMDFEEASGVGLQGGFMAGVDLDRFTSKKFGPVDLRKMDLYVHFFSYDYDDKDVKKGSSIAAETTSMGFHLRYSLHEGKKILPYKMLNWGGVKLHTGYEYSSLKMNLTNKFSESDTSDNFTGSFNATTSADIEITTHSIPLSISTDIQLLYILTLYTGAGTDFNFGKATAKTKISNSNVAISGGGVDATGIAILDLGDKGEPSFSQFRGFVGAQINIFNLKIFAQLDKSFSEDIYGISAGTKLVF